jgi:hypothetical protein
MDDVQKVFLTLVGKASHILHEYFSLILDYFDREHPEITDYQRAILKQLPITCHTTSESALVLIANKRLWDCEMLIRSIMEGTYKFMYLSSGTEIERNKKFDEFWIELPEINNIKRNKRAQELLELIRNGRQDNLNFIRDIILDEETILELSGKYPRKYRKEIEHRWSFGEIVKVLTENDFFKSLNGSFHGYGISSHIVHQDADAATLMYDRNSREDSRREAMELAHGCRLIADVLVYASYRHSQYRRLYFEVVSDPYIESHKQIMQELDMFYKLFQDIESNFNDNKDDANL